MVDHERTVGSSERFRARSLVAAFLAACLVCLTIAARADAYIYWVSANIGSGGGTISRAYLDGTGVDRSFIKGCWPPGGACGGGLLLEQGPAVDSDHIYWTGSFLQGIGRANLDGTGPNADFIGGTQYPNLSPANVAVDADHIYWTKPYYGVIGRANLNGTNVDEGFITDASPPREVNSPFGIAVDANHVYWTNFDSGTIGRANLDGTEVTPGFITAPSALYVAVDANHIYWTNLAAGTIGRANLDGSDVRQNFITGISDLRGVAVDANHVYWSSYFGNIGRANLDGTGVDRSFITGGGGFGRNIAVDALGKTGPPTDPTDPTDPGNPTTVVGSASAKKTQKQKGKRIVVKAKVKAGEDLEVEATGKVLSTKWSYKLKPQTKQVGLGQSKTLRLKPKKKAQKRIAKAMKKAPRLTVGSNLKVKLTDEAGNIKTEKLWVYLKG